MNNSFYKKLIEQPELLKESESTILAVRKRKYLVERIIGCIRGIKQGKYKDFEKSEVEVIVDNLMVRGLINIDKIEEIPINHN